MRLLVIFLLLMFTFLIYNKKTRYLAKKNKSFLYRFKQRFKSKNIVSEKFSEAFINSLMVDPESNINIGTWYSESELREKADIHRARLNKFGKSKMNGEMLFLGPKGDVYKLTSEGKRKYV